MTDQIATSGTSASSSGMEKIKENCRYEIVYRSEANDTSDGIFLPLYMIGGGRGYVHLFMLVKTIAKVNFGEKTNFHGKI